MVADDIAPPAAMIESEPSKTFRVSILRLNEHEMEFLILSRKSRDGQTNSCESENVRCCYPVDHCTSGDLSGSTTSGNYIFGCPRCCVWSNGKHHDIFVDAHLLEEVQSQGGV